VKCREPRVAGFNRRAGPKRTSTPLQISSPGRRGSTGSEGNRTPATQTAETEPICGSTKGVCESSFVVLSAPRWCLSVKAGREVNSVAEVDEIGHEELASSVLHPEFVRWHFEDGVVVQQSREGVDVAAFEGVDVRSEELTFVRGGWSIGTARSTRR